MKRNGPVSLGQNGKMAGTSTRKRVHVHAFVLTLLSAFVLMLSSCGLSDFPGASPVPADTSAETQHETSPVSVKPADGSSGMASAPVPDALEGNLFPNTDLEPSLSAPTGPLGTVQPVATAQSGGTDKESGADGTPSAGTAPVTDSDANSGNDPNAGNAAEPGSAPGPGAEMEPGSHAAGGAEIIVRSDNILSTKEKEALLSDLETQLDDLFGAIDKVSAEPETEIME